MTSTPPFVNVVDHGATGSGSGDESTFIQAAINALPSEGGVVFFPPGVYPVGTGLTLPKPTPVAGVYQNPVTFLGSGKGSTVIQKLNDVILIDASGSVAAGVVTMRSGVELRDLTLSGNNIGSQPLVRCYYGLTYRFDRCQFTLNTGGSALVAVQWWDSYITGCWFNSCGGTTPTIDASYNSGTSQNGNECVRLLSAQQSPQVSNSTMGYSTDNTNNIWFVNCSFTYSNVGGIYIGQVINSNAQPHRIYGVNLKFEDSTMQGPFIRAFGAAHSAFVNVNMNCISLTSITSVDLIHLTNVTDFDFNNIYAQANGSYAAARVFSLFGTDDSVTIRRLWSDLTTSGGSGIAPFNITGRTTSGSNGFAAAVDFNTASSNTNFVIERQLSGSTIRGLPSDASLIGAVSQLRAIAAGGSVTLPAAPYVGQVVSYCAGAGTSGTNQVTIAAPAGAAITGVGLNGVASLLLGVPGACVSLEAFSNTAWQVVSGQQDTGWVPLTAYYASGASNYSGPVLAAFRVQGDVVRLRGAVNTNASGLVATLPTVARPSAGVFWASAVPGMSGTVFCISNVGTAGVLSCSGGASLAGVAFDGANYALGS